MTHPPFGRLLTAMVTPMNADGSVDLDGAARLATHLVDSGNDGIVVSGTTGESPTTTLPEEVELLRVVLDAVGDRATIVKNVGTNDTAHSLELLEDANKGGAHAVMIVSPYYNRPPQSGLIAHCTTIADATDLPVMLYDIPIRTGVAFEPDTIRRLAEHPRIVAMKDAKGDLESSAPLIKDTGLAYYSGDDPLTLPFLEIGAVGVISVIAHFAAPHLRTLIDSYIAGDLDTAKAKHEEVVTIARCIFQTQGVITTKAALGMLGLPGGTVRLPLVDATDEQKASIKAMLTDAGIL